MESKAEKLVVDLAEKLHTPARRDLTFYLVLFFAVLPIWSIVPLSWAFVIYALHSGLIWTFAWRGCGLFALALSEVRPSDRIPFSSRAYPFCRSSSACTTTTSPRSSLVQAPPDLETCSSFRQCSSAFFEPALRPYLRTSMRRPWTLTDLAVRKRRLRSSNTTTPAQWTSGTT